MLEIKTLGKHDTILRAQCSVIPDINGGIRDFAEAMIETMHVGNGIGLAAPQVGELSRLFVVHVQGDIPRVFINPEIIGTSLEMSAYEEGCLSIPNLYYDVDRPAEVTVQAWDERGKPFTLDADGILARVIQHEYDHLKGTLFIDHLTEKKRARLLTVYNRKMQNP